MSLVAKERPVIIYSERPPGEHIQTSLIGRRCCQCFITKERQHYSVPYHMELLRVLCVYCVCTVSESHRFQSLTGWGGFNALNECTSDSQ